ncbi:MAG: Asp-tRNA(Asn)/Glu-tRNA(Gln) amidotransferase subunit GatC [Ferrovum sp.]|nr:Asp-tRNA(Asn)/Glu-tRNA(Gln) amidotransferase subunit GatC [Ferrovum sp.]
MGGVLSDPLNETSLHQLARLACIQLTEQELAVLPQQFDSILGLIDQLQAVDTHGVEPLAQAFDMPVRLRADEVTAKNQRELFQSLAPEVEKGLYLVPKVIE